MPVVSYSCIIMYDCVYVVCFDVLCCFGVLNDNNDTIRKRVMAASPSAVVELFAVKVSTP